jgi:SAM-dependent methyltransferase
MKAQPNSETTQVGHTKTSYIKAFEKAVINSNKKTGLTVLDYGAGKGHGTQILNEHYETFRAFSFEPTPKNWVPSFIDSDHIADSTMDVVICLNVLNVLEPELRDQVVLDIVSKLKDGGVACIGVRAYRDDVDTVKNYEEADEHNAVWINKSVGKVYQKGFDGTELSDYLTDLLGDNVTSVVQNNSFCKKGAIITK